MKQKLKSPEKVFHDIKAKARKNFQKTKQDFGQPMMFALFVLWSKYTTPHLNMHKFH